MSRLHRYQRYALGMCLTLGLLCLLPWQEVRAQAEDPGVADTVSVDSLTVGFGISSVVGIHLVNDEALSALEITIKPSDTLIAIDSASFLGGRLAGYFVKGWVTDDSSGAVTFYCYPSEEPLLQPGTGVLATIHFSHEILPFFPYDVTIDSFTVEFDLIYRTTALRDSLGTVFTPQFRSGILRIVGQSCCTGFTGNINGDSAGSVDLSDLIYLVNFLFLGGDEPICGAAANINGDDGCSIDLSDLIYLVNFLFLGGPGPAACLPSCG